MYIYIIPKFKKSSIQGFEPALLSDTNGIWHREISLINASPPDYIIKENNNRDLISHAVILEKETK